MRTWTRKPGARAEALDAMVYAMAARALVTTNLDAREAELRGEAQPAAPPAVIRSKWLDGV